jgi:hypothetical protein
MPAALTPQLTPATTKESTRTAKPRGKESAADGHASPPSLKFPVHSTQPLQLQRPLSVFGKSFEVYRSSILTLSFDTAMRAVFDISAQTHLRTKAPHEFMLFKKLLYSGTGMHQPSEGTKNLIKTGLNGFVPEALLAAVLEGREPGVVFAPGTDWMGVLRGLEGCEGRVSHDVASQLAAYDALSLELQELLTKGQQVQASAYIQTILGSALEDWQALNARLPANIALLCEVALRTLAWLIVRMSISLKYDPASAEPRVSSLLNPGRRPIGHWMDDVRLAAGRENLKDLAEYLDRLQARHLGREISHDLLKKWSSGASRVMPRSALKPVLRSVRNHEQRQTLQSRYDVARLFTFLCDLVLSGTQGEAPSWADVQAQLKSRHSRVFQIELERVRTGPPDAPA